MSFRRGRSGFQDVDSESENVSPSKTRRSPSPKFQEPRLSFPPQAPTNKWRDSTNYKPPPGSSWVLRTRQAQLEKPFPASFCTELRKAVGPGAYRIMQEEIGLKRDTPEVDMTRGKKTAASRGVFLMTTKAKTKMGRGTAGKSISDIMNEVEKHQKNELLKEQKKYGDGHGRVDNYGSRVRAKQKGVYEAVWNQTLEERERETTFGGGGGKGGKGGKGGTGKGKGGTRESKGGPGGGPVSARRGRSLKIATQEEAEPDPEAELLSPSKPKAAPKVIEVAPLPHIDTWAAWFKEYGEVTRKVIPLAKLTRFGVQYNPREHKMDPKQRPASGTVAERQKKKALDSPKGPKPGERPQTVPTGAKRGNWTVDDENSGDMSASPPMSPLASEPSGASSGGAPPPQMFGRGPAPGMRGPSAVGPTRRGR